MSEHPELGEESDAELADHAEHTWVGVGKFSIHIKRIIDSDQGQGVVVEIYARSFEDCNSISECYAEEADADDYGKEDG